MVRSGVLSGLFDQEKEVSAMATTKTTKPTTSKPRTSKPKTKAEEAQERFLVLVGALDSVQEALDEMDRLLKRQYKPVAVNWRVRTDREMQALRRTAQAKLDDLRETAKHYERDMIAREWRP